jgi:hypothetical protein
MLTCPKATRGDSRCQLTLFGPAEKLCHENIDFTNYNLSNYLYYQFYLLFIIIL